MDINVIGFGTVGVYLLTELAKKIPLIPVLEGQTARIRTVAGVLAFVGVGLNAYLNGSWNDFVSSQDVQVLLQTVVVFAGTWIVHKTRNGFSNLVDRVKNR